MPPRAIGVVCRHHHNGRTAAPPAGSQPGTDTWVRSERAFEEGSAVVTDDTVFTGFGAEGLTGAPARANFIKRSMGYLLRR